MEAFGEVHYYLDVIRTDKVSGWLYNPNKKSTLSIKINGSPPLDIVTDIYRSDVAQVFKNDKAKFSGFELLGFKG